MTRRRLADCDCATACKQEHKRHKKSKHRDGSTERKEKKHKSRKR